MNDIETLEVENKMLRERNERLLAQHDKLFAMWPGGMEEVEASLREQEETLRDACMVSDLYKAERDTAIKAYRDLLLKYDRMEAAWQK